VLVTAAAVGIQVRRRARRVRLDWTPGGGTEHLGPPLAHRSLGAGPPRVLLLHGLAGSGRYWGGAYDALAADGALVVPDLAGFGRSVDAPGPYDLAGHADAVAELLRSRQVGAPVVVGAHSFGTNVAVALAARHPDLVRAIVAFGPPWYPDPEVARARLHRMGPMARIFALDARWSHRVCEWVCRHRELAARLAVVARGDLPAPVAADGVRHTWASYEQTLRSILSAAVAAYLHSASVPITVLAGDSDGLVDRRYLQALAAAGTIRLETWRGNHDLPLARGQECAGVLATVASCPGPPGSPPAMRGAAGD
jgi:pimeloyl-ACP methyl ester carboxylesterase